MLFLQWSASVQIPSKNILWHTGAVLYHSMHHFSSKYAYYAWHWTFSITALGVQSLTYSALWKIKIRTIFLRTSNGIASIWMAWIIIWMNIFKLALMKTSGSMGSKASISSSKQPCTGQICFCLKTQCHHIFYRYNQTCSWGHLYLAVTFSLSIIENFIWIEPLLRGHLS